jgi:hypothetical protein
MRAIMRIKALPLLATLALMFVAPASEAQMATVPAPPSAKGSAPGILNREQAAAILPATVFFRGQSATIQGRNAAGVRLPDGKLVLFAVVDTAGYSSAIQQKYQAYLITEVAITLGDQRLSPGAYGFGFVEDNRVVVMDLGGNEVLHATTTHDATLARPNPLQVLPDSTADRYRLYLGRSYVAFRPATN